MVIRVSKYPFVFTLPTVIQLKVSLINPFLTFGRMQESGDGSLTLVGAPPMQFFQAALSLQKRVDRFLKVMILKLS
jgi:hypothetical protein